MNELNRNSRHGAGGGGRKAFAMLGAVAFLGAAAYLSNSPLPPAPAVAAERPEGEEGRGPHRRRGRGGQRVPRCARRQAAGEGAARVRQRQEAELVQPPGDLRPAQRREARRPDEGAAGQGDGRGRRRAQQGRVPEGRRHHGRRPEAARQPQGRQGQGRREGADVRQGPVLPGDLRPAVRDEAVDGAVRRPPPRGQRHRGRQALRPHPHPHRGAARALQARRRRGAAARPGERRRVQADGRAGREAAEAGGHRGAAARRTAAGAGTGREGGPRRRGSRARR